MIAWEHSYGRKPCDTIREFSTYDHKFQKWYKVVCVCYTHLTIELSLLCY